MTAPRTWSRLAPDDRQGQILAAAAKVFNDRAFDEVSTTELAAAAGVSRGLLNHYFRTKRDLYLAVVRSLIDLPAPPMPDHLAALSLDQRLHESVRGWLDLTEARAALWMSALNLSMLGHDPEVKALVDEATEQVVDRILQVADVPRSTRRREAVRAALRGYAGYANVLTAQWLQEGHLRREQVHLLLEGVLRTIVADLLSEL